MGSEQEIIAAQAEIERLKDKVAGLEDQLYWLRKKMFGKMSEKNLPLDPTALCEPGLFDEALTDEERVELEAAVKKDEEETANLIKVKTFERKPRKAVDTANLEVREEHIYPEVENREDYTELEPEVTDTLILVPAQIYVRRIVRHKLVLKSNRQIKEPERNAFELAPLPVMPLPKCMASESLLADVILQKFIYHLPFYRVIQKYKEMGVNISDSTMNDWYAAACEKLKLLLYGLLVRVVLSRDYVQVDESTLPVIDNAKHRAVKGYMWCIHAVMEKLVAFYYDMGARSHETATRSSRSSRIEKAISYTLPLLPRLSRYVNDGRFCIDNNLVENAIRPLDLGRKNFLFCWTPS